MTCLVSAESGTIYIPMTWSLEQSCAAACMETFHNSHISKRLTEGVCVRARACVCMCVRLCAFVCVCVCVCLCVCNCFYYYVCICILYACTYIIIILYTLIQKLIFGRAVFIHKEDGHYMT